MKNTGRNLHAHHVAPKAANPELENVLENGIALCYNCHRNGIHDGNGGISNSEKAQRIKAAIREQKENEILVTIPKGEREKIKAAAATAGMSMNAFIVEAIAEKIGK